jgi:CRISPR/Cas system-associated exonuclease Cas4 (RecB family)
MSVGLQAFAALLEERQRAERLKKHQKSWQPAATPASSLGYRCERRLVYTRVLPLEAAPPSEELASIFEEGHHHHAQVRRELGELGFEVVDVETQFNDEGLDLRGTIDGRIIVDGRRIPVEIKSVTGNGPRSAEEWAASENQMLRRYYDQLQIYLYLTGEEEGLGIFKDKITGTWRVAAVRLDLGRAEELLKRAERVRDAVVRYKQGVNGDREAGMPARIPDRSECGGCPFAHLCLPADAPADPLQLAQDPELLAEIELHEGLSLAAREFKKVDEELKTRFKLTSGDRFLVGEKFLVTKKTNKAGAVSIKFEPVQGGGNGAA